MNTPRSVPLCLSSCLCPSLPHSYARSPTLTSHAHTHRVEGWCHQQPRNKLQESRKQRIVKKCWSPPSPTSDSLQLPFPANIIMTENSSLILHMHHLPDTLLPAPRIRLLAGSLMQIACSSCWLEVLDHDATFSKSKPSHWNIKDWRNEDSGTFYSCKFS